MTDFFTSDIHFGHKNIIEYCGRPWSNIHDMNEGIIRNWNSVVAPNDNVYITGDVCMGKLQESIKNVKRLNGNKHLVAGNHDVKARKMPAFRDEFVWIKDYHEANFIDPETGKKQRIIMSHYPMMIWHKNHHGSWMVCGHSHGSLPQTRPEFNGVGKILDLGIDVHNYFPIDFTQLKAIMDKKELHLPDHHEAAEPTYVPEYSGE